MLCCELSVLPALSESCSSNAKNSRSYGLHCHSFTEYINRMSDIADWFKRLPFFTRWWLALTAGFSLFGRFGLLKAYYLVLLYEPFIKQFQVSSRVKLCLIQCRI